MTACQTNIAVTHVTGIGNAGENPPTPPRSIISREKRRAKTDRVDAEMLLRVFLGWLRGERGHCSMVAVPTIDAEDARRPGREREALVAERTRIINRMKADTARLGVHGFKPHLRSAPKKLGSVRIPEGVAIPPNTMAELERDMVRLAVLREQIAAIEQTRLERIEAAPDDGSHAMIPSSPASLASASRRRTCW